MYWRWAPRAWLGGDEQGKFEDSVDARSALKNCCNCGGGYTPRCIDVPNWEDREGLRCADYEALRYCETDGSAGPQWRNRGLLSAATDLRNHSVIDSCCACGGGLDKLPKKNDPREATGEVTRTTWKGCKCVPGWESKKGVVCDGACCNPDNDTFGNWCMVEEPDCQGGSWGLCRPKHYVPRVCEDEYPFWEDAGGHSCADYGVLGFCTADGEYGVRWENGYKTENDPKHRNAFQVCCNCGGGKIKENCVNKIGWQDNDENTCDTYALNALCTSDGRAGPGLQYDTKTFEQLFVGKIHPREACCACGYKGLALPPANPPLPDFPIMKSEPTGVGSGNFDKGKATQVEAQQMPTMFQVVMGNSFVQFTMVACGFGGVIAAFVFKRNRRDEGLPRHIPGSSNGKGRRYNDGL